MAWTRIDDKFLMNQKIQSAGAYGMALYLSGLIYCNTNLTDGYIPDVMLPALCGLAYQTPSKRVASLLVDLNLWERVSGGYQIHDFLTFNKSKQEIETMNKQRAANGAKNKPEAKQADTEAGTETGTRTLSESVPIIPNTLIPIKESTTATAREEISEVVKAYESEVGVLTGMIREKLAGALEEYPKDWIVKALEECASKNKRNWSYADAILKRWKVDGFQSDSRQRVSNPGYKKQTDRRPDIPGYVSDRSNEVVVYD